MRRIMIPAALLLGGCVGNPLPPTVLTRELTVEGIGAGQGAAVVEGRIYLYGDRGIGEVREYEFRPTPVPSLEHTGRRIELTRSREDLLSHPTGLAWHPTLGCFIGDTVRRIGWIHHVDFTRALADGNLDHAVLNSTRDDLAINGTRPEFVRLAGRWVIATSDYGPGPNFVRFYDPVLLARAKTTSEPGVLLGKVPCGPWVQSLHWIDQTGQLVLVQNRIEGLLWRLTVVSDLRLPDFRSGPAVRVLDFQRPKDELEGYVQIAGRVGLFVTSSRKKNVTIAITGERARR
jgi:hypothetical protein